jgi:isopenicillin-N epimerase
MYTGACHKWMMTPKSCSFLYVKREWQDMLDPLLISWGFESASPSHSRFLDYHQGQGTRDFSAFLTVPRAIRFMREYDWEMVAAGCRGMVQKNALRFCGLMNSAPLCPIGDEFLGQMFSIPVTSSKPELLKHYLFDNHKIEIPVMTQDKQVYIRYSINAFNSHADLDKLYLALEDTLANTDFLQPMTHPVESAFARNIA